MVLSRLPTVRFCFGPRKDEFVRRAVPAVVCRCFTNSSPKGRVFGTKMEPARGLKKTKWRHKESKTSQGTFKNTPCGTGSKSDKKGVRSLAVGCHFLITTNKNIRNSIQKPLTHESQKNMKMMPKRCQERYRNHRFVNLLAKG